MRGVSSGRNKKSLAAWAGRAALISSEFPGLFSKRALQRMGLLEMLVWERLAKAERIRRRMEAAQAARVALASDDDYKAFMSDRQSEIRELLKGKEQVIAENWDWLKTIARKGKKR